MNAERVLELVFYLCSVSLRRAPRDPAQDEKIVSLLEECGVLENVPLKLPPPASTIDKDHQLLEAADVAEILGVHESWVRVHYRELPHILIGNGERPRVRFRRKALLAWIEQHEIDWRKKK
jgi:hypothetical protein